MATAMDHLPCLAVNCCLHLGHVLFLGVINDLIYSAHDSCHSEHGLTIFRGT